MPEVIEIVSSDDEQQDHKSQPANEPQEYGETQHESELGQRQETNSDTITLSASNLILQARRLRINSIFNEYGRCHNLLLNLQHLMDSEQHQRWQNHLNSKDKPIHVDSSEAADLPLPRDSYSYSRSPPRYEPYRPQSRAVTGYARRRPPARRRAPKRRRAAPKRSPVKRSSVGSHVQSGATSRPSTSASSSVKVERTRVKSEPRISVKKERVT